MAHYKIGSNNQIYLPELKLLISTITAWDTNVDNDPDNICLGITIFIFFQENKIINCRKNEHGLLLNHDKNKSLIALTINHHIDLTWIMH